MEKISLDSLIPLSARGHFNKLFATTNDHCLRIAVNEHMTYEWHSHPNSDEVFFVTEGCLTIEFQDSPAIVLKPGDFLKVARGVVHRTVIAERTVNLCFERSDAETVFVSDPLI